MFEDDNDVIPAHAQSLLNEINNSEHLDRGIRLELKDEHGFFSIYRKSKWATMLLRRDLSNRMVMHFLRDFIASIERAPLIRLLNKFDGRQDS